MGAVSFNKSSNLSRESELKKQIPDASSLSSEPVWNKRCSFQNRERTTYIDSVESEHRRVENDGIHFGFADGAKLGNFFFLGVEHAHPRTADVANWKSIKKTRAELLPGCSHLPIAQILISLAQMQHVRSWSATSFNLLQTTFLSFSEIIFTFYNFNNKTESIKKCGSKKGLGKGKSDQDDSRSSIFFSKCDKFLDGIDVVLSLDNHNHDSSCWCSPFRFSGPDTAPWESLLPGDYATTERELSLARSALASWLQWDRTSQMLWHKRVS